MLSIRPICGRTRTSVPDFLMHLDVLISRVTLSVFNFPRLSKGRVATGVFHHAWRRMHGTWTLQVGTVALGSWLSAGGGEEEARHTH